jgi:electron transfer flavoprotein alpha subunit
MILGLVEHEGGEIADTSLEMLTLAGRLARGQGLPLEAVLIGSVATGMADTLRAYGVSVVHAVHHERFDRYAPEAWAGGVVGVVEALVPQVVLAAGTDRGNELMAHAAARLGLPMSANCADVEPGDAYLVTRLRWGGSLLEEARLHGKVKLLTVAPHSLRPEPAPAPSELLTVVPVSPSPSDREFRVQVARRLDPPGNRVSLAEARVVVGGGRGVGSAEGFRALEELAELLGGAVGCSRVVTSLGWRHHSDQVGQTGIRIAPDLYIACGISGAIQHMVGCKGAKTILAINTDTEAPIVTKATYAIIGDVGEIVPAVNAELRRVLGR